MTWLTRRGRLGAVARLLTGVALVVTLSVPSAGGLEPGGERPGSRPAGEPYESLEAAASAGAVDTGLAELLGAGRPVLALAVLDGRATLRSYADGGERAVAAAAAAAERTRRDALEDVRGVEILESYRLMPVLYLRIADEASALKLVNKRSVLSLLADEEHVHWTAQSLPVISQPTVAAMGHTGAGVGVAVIDTGVDFTRAAFGPCASPGAPAAPGGTCRVRTAFDTAGDDAQADADGHGTNVAAIVAAVAPGAHLISIDAFDGDRAWSHDVIEGLDWVVANRKADNIRAVNLSLGSARSYTVGNCSQNWFGRSPYLQPFSFLHQTDVLTVVAAGNDAAADGGFTDGIGSPACVGDAVAVGAVYDAPLGARSWSSCTDTTTVVDQVTCFSQDGDRLDLLAPGALVTAAGSTLGGTSQAAPHVAGATAVLAALVPGSTASDLRRYLTTSRTVVTDPRSGRTHPRLDLFAAVRAAVPVPNDDRAAAAVLSRWGGHLAQTTWGATSEPGEVLHAGMPGGSSVWYAWTADRAGTATFTTRGSGFDTLLAVYQPHGSGLLPVAANDDAPGATTSTVQAQVVAGQQLLVAVDGKRPPGSPFAASGQLRLTWNIPHDNIADALHLTPGTPAVGTTIGATRQTGEPSHGDAFADASVWYRWTPSGTGVATITIGSSFGVLAAVYSGGPGFTALTRVSSGNNGPQQASTVTLTFPYSATTTYWLAIDGESYEYACNDVTGQCWYRSQTGSYTVTLVS